MNHHDVLGVGASAGQAEIKKAFHKAAKEFHPDVNDSPEAAKKFARIKEAHDALLKQAETPRESVTAQASATRATAATAQATYAQPDPVQMTDEELARVQDLDEKARQPQKHSFFHRSKEPAEIRRHRKKIKTNERRLRGLY